MMGHRERLKSGDEYDALTRWRRFLRFRSRVRKAIKRQVNKRARKMWTVGRSRLTHVETESNAS